MYGAKIASIRLARGYNQEYLSKKLGISQKEYSKIECNEKVKIDDTLLKNIADILGVSIEDIKSPTPIIMNFHDSPYCGQYNQNTNINETIITELTGQLQVKDQMIAQLLEQNISLEKQLEKLIEKKIS